MFSHEGLGSTATAQKILDPEIWIHETTKSKTLSPRKLWELFGSRGDPRLRLAQVLEARGAFAEAEPLRRRDLEATERQLGPEHRETLTTVNNFASVLERLGKFSEAPLMCCAAVMVAGGWCCILCWAKLGKIAGKQQPHFQRISEFVSAMLHEQVNFTQIILNHLKSRHIWRCQYMDMSKFSKRCLQRTDAALQVSVSDV